MDKKQIAAEFRVAARALQKWVRTNFNILVSDFDSQRELQRLIREVDARAILLEFRFPDVDLTGLNISPVRYMGWCRVPYSLAKTVKNPASRSDVREWIDAGMPSPPAMPPGYDPANDLVDCYSLECSTAWNRAIDSLVTAADLIAAVKAADGGKSDSPWTPDKETEARRLMDAGTVTTASALREMLSMRQADSQALFRHITGKRKKRHQRD